VSDESLMEMLHAEVVQGVSIGPWQVTADALADAVTSASRGGHPQLPVLNDAAAGTLEVRLDASGVCTIVASSLRREVRVDLPLIRALCDDPTRRRVGLEGLRSSVDWSVDAWQGEVERLMNEPSSRVRMRVLTEYQEAAATTSYDTMIGRWRRDARLAQTDLHAPPAARILSHLRFHREAVAVENWSGAWSGAWMTLLHDDGLSAAVERLTAIPLPIPEPVLIELRQWPQPALRDAVRRLLALPESPVSRIQLLRVLWALSGEVPAFRRLARRRARHLFSEEWDNQVLLLREVALHALEPESGPSSLADEAAADRSFHPTARLIASWYHAHRIVREIGDSGDALATLAARMAMHASPLANTLFDPVAVSGTDIANPAHLASRRLAVAGLQYAMRGVTAEPAEQALVDLLALRSSRQVGALRAPAHELLEDLDALGNTLGTWLAPQRDADGALSIGGVTVFDAAVSPRALRDLALTWLTESTTESAGWRALVSATGRSRLTDDAAAKFEAIVRELNVPEMLRALPDDAVFILSLISRQIAVASDSSLKASFRQVLFDRLTSPTEPTGHFDADRQLPPDIVATLEALYWLASGESTRQAALSAFAADLLELGRRDAAILRHARALLEQLVRSLQLTDAELFVGVLSAARGS
jgi:hypothetical protein